MTTSLSIERSNFRWYLPAIALEISGSLSSFINNAPFIQRTGQSARQIFGGKRGPAPSQRDLRVREALDCQFIAESFNLFNRTNVRSVNPNYQRAGEPLSAFDPRQIQLAVRLRF
jgi:hypothetical protein